MSKIQLIDLNKTLQACELVKKTEKTELQVKLNEEANKRIRAEHADEVKTYKYARTYIAK